MSSNGQLHSYTFHATLKVLLSLSLYRSPHILSSMFGNNYKWLTLKVINISPKFEHVKHCWKCLTILPLYKEVMILLLFHRHSGVLRWILQSLSFDDYVSHLWQFHLFAKIWSLVTIIWNYRIFWERGGGGRDWWPLKQKQSSSISIWYAFYLRDISFSMLGRWGGGGGVVHRVEAELHARAPYTILCAKWCILRQI